MRKVKMRNVFDGVFVVKASHKNELDTTLAEARFYCNWPCLTQRSRVDGHLCQSGAIFGAVKEQSQLDRIGAETRLCG